MAEFTPAVALVLAHEGGYTPGLPGDPGGETNFGIAKRWHPTIDIKALTREQATAIYLSEYWKPFMEQEPDQRVANCVLDCAVSQGPATAAQFYTQFGHDLRAFQVARLLHYALQWKPADFHSWFTRTLDV